MKHAKLVFTTADADTKKNSMLQIWGSDNMLLYEHTGKVRDTSKFDDAIDKIRKGLQRTINEVYPMY